MTTGMRLLRVFVCCRLVLITKWNLLVVKLFVIRRMLLMVSFIMVWNTLFVVLLNVNLSLFQISATVPRRNAFRSKR